MRHGVLTGVGLSVLCGKRAVCLFISPQVNRVLLRCVLSETHRKKMEASKTDSFFLRSTSALSLNER